MNPKLWAVGPNVVRGRKKVPGEPENTLTLGGAVTTFWDHDDSRLHRVFIREIGGIGEPNAGEFLIETPCGFNGWVRQINKNPDACPACEACLNGAESRWNKFPVPEGAVVADLRPKSPEPYEGYLDDE